MTGLLPSVSLEANEETLRKEICEVIHSYSSPDLSSIEPKDFEFISVHGKHAVIPQCNNGFKWNGRAVKELAGSGSAYVRLIKDCAHSHSDNDDLPPGPCANSFENGSNAMAGSNVLLTLIVVLKNLIFQVLLLNQALLILSQDLLVLH